MVASEGVAVGEVDGPGQDRDRCGGGLASLPLLDVPLAILVTCPSAVPLCVGPATAPVVEIVSEVIVVSVALAATAGLLLFFLFLFLFFSRFLFEVA